MLAFSSDGRYLATGSGEEVRVFEVTSGKEVSRLTSQGAVDAVAFSRDGRYITSASGFMEIVINRDPVRPQDLIDEVCAHLSHNLKRDVWGQYLDKPYRKTCPDLPD